MIRSKPPLELRSFFCKEPQRGGNEEDKSESFYIIKIKIMQELINRLMENAGISEVQAAKALETIKDFVKEKFPMLGGAVDNMFGAAGKEDEDGL